MSTEVTGLHATSIEDGVILSWGVSSTSYLTGFDLIIKTGGAVIDRRSMPVSQRSVTISPLDPSKTYEFNVRALVEVGGKTVQAKPLPGKEEPLPPPPPPPAEGTILWKGDATEPLDQQWSEVSDEEHCGQVSSPSNLPDSRITVVSDSRFSKGKAIKLVLRATDHGCYTGRTELGTGNPMKSGKTGFPWVFDAGDEVWIAMEALWPQGAPGGLFQLHEYEGPGSPPFGFGPGGNAHPSSLPAKWEGHLQNDDTPGGAVTPLTLGGEPVQADTVYRAVVHAKFALSQTGLIEVYLGAKAAGVPSLAYSNHACSLLKSGYEPTHIRVGNYLGVTPKAESILYLAGFTAATTRAAAEANAFN